MRKQTFVVTDMHCTNCALKIDSLEDELPGVKSVSASYTKGHVVVEYDENLISSAQFVAAVKRKGYTALLPE
jgi:copper chaperone CopZ